MTVSTEEVLGTKTPKTDSEHPVDRGEDTADSTDATPFLPELVDSREDGDGSVPDVAGVVHLAALHLHLGVLQPQGDVAVVDIQSSFVDGASSEEDNIKR